MREASDVDPGLYIVLRLLRPGGKAPPSSYQRKPRSPLPTNVLLHRLPHLQGSVLAVRGGSELVLVWFTNPDLPSLSSLLPLFSSLLLLTVVPLPVATIHGAVSHPLPSRIGLPYSNPFSIPFILSTIPRLSPEDSLLSLYHDTRIDLFAVRPTSIANNPVTFATVANSESPTTHRRRS
ncbi:hypothetical protein F5B20DRAFT_514701 [Whalleya microplaca]|nr:hypothetical protein F5B20DRAFT_514701 [Whalleya microplaca]